MPNEYSIPAIGCSGWSEGKQKYFTHFDAVELQGTFYDLPSVTLAAKWHALAPASFHFCMKAWQLITHTPASPTYRKLKSKLAPKEHEFLGSFQNTEQVQQAWERTAAVARAVQARVILFQCPASFGPEAQNVRNLRTFFRVIQREKFALAWEPRGGWTPDLVSGLCKDLDLLLCVDPLESDSTASLAAPYWRLHGRGGYHYRYTEDDLRELYRLMKCPERDYPPHYIFFNNIWMRDDSQRFKQYLLSEMEDGSHLL